MGPPGLSPLLLTALRLSKQNVLLEPNNEELASFLQLHTGTQIVNDRSAADFRGCYPTGARIWIRRSAYRDR